MKVHANTCVGQLASGYRAFALMLLSSGLTPAEADTRARDMIDLETGFVEEVSQGVQSAQFAHRVNELGDRLARDPREAGSIEEGVFTLHFEAQSRQLDVDRFEATGETLLKLVVEDKSAKLTPEQIVRVTEALWERFGSEPRYDEFYDPFCDDPFRGLPGWELRIARRADKAMVAA